MSQPRPSVKKTFVAYLWQPIKSVLCVAQLIILQNIATLGIQDMVSRSAEGPQVWHSLLYVLNAIILTVALWKFYDSVDDFAFLALKDEKDALNGKVMSEDMEDAEGMEDLEALYGVTSSKPKEEKMPTPFLRRPVWLLALGLSTIGAAYPLTSALWHLLAWTGIHGGIGIPLCVLLSVAGFAAFRAWQVHKLYGIWCIQIGMVKPGQKFASLVKRLIQCAALFVGLFFACLMGFTYAIVALFVFLYEVANAIWKVLVVVLFLFAILFIIEKARLLLRWRSFLRKLKEAAKRGDISYEVEGRPYLSALFPSLYAAIKISDWRRVHGEPVHYCVAIANFKRRRGGIILCDDHMIQIRHEIRLRFGASAMILSSMNENNGSRTSHALAHWYTTRGVEFPEGEGKRVLIVDPAPAYLYVRKGYSEQVSELDNGAEVYDYTVWTKNAFFNYIDRT